jgi:hypothetical protein
MDQRMFGHDYQGGAIKLSDMVSLAREAQDHAAVASYKDGACDALRKVLTALGDGVSPSFVVVHVAEEMGVDLAAAAD